MIKLLNIEPLGWTSMTVKSCAHGMRLESGELRVHDEDDEDCPTQNWGPWKAVELLQFSAKAGILK